MCIINYCEAKEVINIKWLIWLVRCNFLHSVILTVAKFCLLNLTILDDSKMNIKLQMRLNVVLFIAYILIMIYVMSSFWCQMFKFMIAYAMDLTVHSDMLTWIRVCVLCRTLLPKTNLSQTMTIKLCFGNGVRQYQYQMC